VTAGATAVIVALAANLLWGWWQGSDPVLVKRVSDLEQAHQETASAVTIMKDTVGTLVSDVRNTNSRVSALEDAAQNAAAGTAPDLAPLTKRLDVLEQKIGSLRAGGQQPTQATPASDLSALNERIAALEAKLSSPTAPSADVAGLNE
jgi:BMFP domain-containing protein YqiC